MRYKFFRLLPWVAALAGCQSAPPHFAQTGHTTHASLPVYLVEYQAAHRFQQESELLHNTIEQSCRQAKPDVLPLKTQWQQTMSAWMALQGQERGPVSALEQSWNVQFWPDKKNTTGRKMHAALQQEKTWTAEEISRQSVAVQGLGAIEWLLFDQNSSLTNGSNSACAFAVAISENLADNAQVIEQAWQHNPWNNMDSQTWDTEYMALLANQLEYTLSKLTRPMANIGHPRPYFSESWRSNSSMNNLKANIEAMQSLYLAGLDQRLRDKHLVALADRVSSQYANLLENWPAEPSLFAMLQTKDGYRELLSQYNKLEQLKYLLRDEVAVELGVVIGFNSSDGD